jgi:hypothetical protein
LQGNINVPHDLDFSEVGLSERACANRIHAHRLAAHELNCPLSFCCGRFPAESESVDCRFGNPGVARSARPGGWLMAL